jgi:hypothetical protein
VGVKRGFVLPFVSKDRSDSAMNPIQLNFPVTPYQGIRAIGATAYRPLLATARLSYNKGGKKPRAGHKTISPHGRAVQTANPLNDATVHRTESAQ